MIALAYLLPPITGLVAYLKGATPRARFHGLQSVLLGVLWPAALYVCSWVSPSATRIAFVVAAALWLVALLGTALGRNPGVPGLRSRLATLAEESPRAA